MVNVNNEGLGVGDQYRRNSQRLDDEKAIELAPIEARKSAVAEKIDQLRAGVPLPAKKAEKGEVEVLGGQFVKQLNQSFVDRLKKHSDLQHTKPSKTQNVLGKISPFKTEKEETMDELIDKIANSLNPQNNPKLQKQIKAEILSHNKSNKAESKPVQEALGRIKKIIIDAKNPSTVSKEESYTHISDIRNHLSLKLRQDMKEVEIVANPILGQRVSIQTMDENAVKYLNLIKDDLAGGYVRKNGENIHEKKLMILDYFKFEKEITPELAESREKFAKLFAGEDKELSVDIELLFYTAEDSKPLDEAVVDYLKAYQEIQNADHPQEEQNKIKELNAAFLKKFPILEEIVKNNQLEQLLNAIEDLFQDVSKQIKDKTSGGYPPSYLSIQELKSKIETYNSILSSKTKLPIRQLNFRKELIEKLSENLDRLLTPKVLKDAVAREIEELELEVRRQINPQKPTPEHSQSKGGRPSISRTPSFTPISEAAQKESIRANATRYLELISDENAIGYLSDSKNAQDAAAFKEFIFKYFYPTKDPSKPNSLYVIYSDIATFVDHSIAGNGETIRDVMLFLQTTTDPKIRQALNGLSDAVKVQKKIVKEEIYRSIIKQPAFQKFLENKEFEQSYQKIVSEYTAFREVIGKGGLPSIESIDHVKSKLEQCIKLIKESKNLNNADVKKEQLKEMAKLCDSLLTSDLQKNAMRREIENLSSEIKESIDDLNLTRKGLIVLNDESKKAIAKYLRLLNDPRAEEYVISHQKEIAGLRARIYEYLQPRMSAVEISEAYRIYTHFKLDTANIMQSEAYKEICIALMLNRFDKRFKFTQLNNAARLAKDPEFLREQQAAFQKKLAELKSEAINAKKTAMAALDENQADKADYKAKNQHAKKLSTEISKIESQLSEISRLVNAEKAFKEHTSSIAQKCGSIAKEQFKVPFAKAQEHYNNVKDKIDRLQRLEVKVKEKIDRLKPPSDEEMKEFENEMKELAKALQECHRLTENQATNHFVSAEKALVDKMKVILAVYRTQKEQNIFSPKLFVDMLSFYSEAIKRQNFSFQSQIELIPYLESLSNLSQEMANSQVRETAMKNLEPLQKSNAKLWEAAIRNATAGILAKTIDDVSLKDADNQGLILAKKNEDASPKDADSQNLMRVNSGKLLLSLPASLMDEARIMIIKNSYEKLKDNIKQEKSKNPEKFEGGQLPNQVVKDILKIYGNIDKAPSKAPYKSILTGLDELSKNYQQFKTTQFDNLKAKYEGLKAKKDPQAYLVCEQIEKAFEGTKEFAALDRANAVKTAASKDNANNIFIKADAYLQSKDVKADLALAKIESVQGMTYLKLVVEHLKLKKGKADYQERLINKALREAAIVVEDYVGKLKELFQVPPIDPEKQKENIGYLKSINETFKSKVGNFLEGCGADLSKVSSEDVRFAELYQKLISQESAINPDTFIKDVMRLEEYLNSKNIPLVKGEDRKKIDEACKNAIHKKLEKCMKLLKANDKKDMGEKALQSEFALFNDPQIEAYIRKKPLYEENRMFQKIKMNLDILKNISAYDAALNAYKKDKRPSDAEEYLKAREFLNSPKVQNALKNNLIEQTIKSKLDTIQKNTSDTETNRRIV